MLCYACGPGRGQRREAGSAGPSGLLLPLTPASQCVLAHKRGSSARSAAARSGVRSSRPRGARCLTLSALRLLSRRNARLSARRTPSCSCRRAHWQRCARDAQLQRRIVHELYKHKSAHTVSRRFAMTKSSYGPSPGVRHCFRSIRRSALKSTPRRKCSVGSFAQIGDESFAQIDRRH